MVELRVERDELVLHLTNAEKLEGVHGDLRVPLSMVRAVEVLDDAHGPVWIHAGMKLGPQLPGIGRRSRSSPWPVTCRP